MSPEDFFDGDPEYPGVNWGCVGVVAVLALAWIVGLALVVGWLS